MNNSSRMHSHSGSELVAVHHQQRVAEGANPGLVGQEITTSAAVKRDGSSIQPFNLEGLNGAIQCAATRQQALMSQQPSLVGTKGLGANIGTDPQVGSISGMSESSSQTSLQSQELNRLNKLGQSHTFGQLALQRHLNQNKKQKFEVYMRCVTWSRDSHGLFDYESRYISKKNIKTGQSGRIVRLNNDVEFIDMDMAPEELDPTAKPLITITQNARGKFVITNDSGSSETSRQRRRDNPEAEDQEQNNAANMMFVVVRNLKSQKPPEDQQQDGQQQNSFLHDFRLQRGNIIKLGRLKFSVKDFRTDKQPANCDLKRRGVIDRSASPVKQRYRVAGCKGAAADGSSLLEGDEDSENEFNAEEAVEIDCGVVEKLDKDGVEVQCKVCWSSEQTRTNPLLNSCKCDGSVRFIHYECLKFWLKQKMAVKEEPNQVSYMWKQFECEICKTPYPYVFKSNGNRYRLVDVEIPKDKNFLWLESLTFEKNSSRMVHVVMPDRDHTQFKMGRGHESDLRVSDISVSRCHAILKYDTERTHNYYLEDNLSKFGTLVLSEHPIELEVDQTQAVQIGRSVISFTVKQVVESPTSSGLSASEVEQNVPRILSNQPAAATLQQQIQSYSGLDRSPPQVLESVGLYSAAQQKQAQPLAASIIDEITPSRQQVIPAGSSTFEEQKQLLRTPSPVRRNNPASALMSASNQQTAYRPNAYNRLETSNPRMPAAVLLDHHSTNFTPIAPRLQVQNQRMTVRELDGNDCNRSDESSFEEQQEQDPSMAAEILRQKIEETNQKISDYFRQQQRLTASQLKHQQSAILPQRLDFYGAVSPQPSRTYMVDEVKEDNEASLQRSQPGRRQKVPNLDFAAAGVLSQSHNQQYSNESDGERQTNNNKCKATESLNQTLKRFQSMIQQVEQRFAEQEKFNAQNLGVNSAELKERKGYQVGSQAVSPQRHQQPLQQQPQRSMNEYDIAKQQIEQKQRLLNSQYSLNPASSHGTTAGAAHSRYTDYNDNGHSQHYQQHVQKQPSYEQSDYPASQPGSASRSNLLQVLNRAVKNHQTIEQLHQGPASPVHGRQQQTAAANPCHYELSRERAIQQAISRSPTKMYQANECLSPQSSSYKYHHKQPLGDMNSFRGSLLDQSNNNNPDSISLSRSSIIEPSSKQPQPSSAYHPSRTNISDLQQHEMSMIQPYQQRPRKHQDDPPRERDQSQRDMQHMELLTKINETIKRSEKHNASVNDRLQKAKSLIVPNSYERQAHGYGQKNNQSSPIKNSQERGPIKHVQSYNHGYQQALKALEANNKQVVNHGRYDVDFFGASDIAINQQASPVRAERSVKAHTTAKRQQSYNMLSSQGSRVNKARQDHSSSANLKQSISRGGTSSTNQTMTHHDYSRQQQASPVHKRQHQASPSKSSHKQQQHQYPQSAYKSPMRPNHSSNNNNQNSYAAKHGQQSQQVYSQYQRQSQQQPHSIPSYSASRYDLKNQSSSFYDQARASPSRGQYAPSRYMDHHAYSRGPVPASQQQPQRYQSP